MNNTIYLYVKTHPTGLKYLGKTIKDPFKYKGSGTYWLIHLAKHGEEHSTEILFESNDKKLFKEKALYYSKLYNVVESKEWANIVLEQGDGGDTSMSPAYQEFLKRRDLSGEKNPFYGKTHTEENRKKFAENASKQWKGVPKSEETRKKMSENNCRYWKGKVAHNKGVKQGPLSIEEKLKRNAQPCRYQGQVYYSLKACAAAHNTTKYKIEKLVERISVEDYIAATEK